MNKKILLTPGPVNISKDLKERISNFSDMCHREQRYKDLAKRVKEKLSLIYHCNEELEVALLNGSGTTAIEAMVRSFGKNKSNLVIINGVYGNRIYSILKDTECKSAWSITAKNHWFTKEEIFKKVRDYTLDVDNVFIIHHETTTGVLNDINEISKYIKICNDKIKVFADCTSSFGAEEINWSYLDGISFSSNKCIESIPGVAVVMYKSKLKDFIISSGELTNLKKYWDDAIPYTPNTLAVYVLDRALDILNGCYNVRQATYIQKSKIIKKISLETIIPEEENSSFLTTFRAQYSITEYERYMYENGFVIYNMNNGMNNCFRISVMGNIIEADLHDFVKLTNEFINQNNNQYISDINFR